MRDEEVDAVQLESIRQRLKQVNNGQFITGSLSKANLKVDGRLEHCLERLREDVGHLVLYSGDMHRCEGDWTFGSRLRQDLASHELVK